MKKSIYLAGIIFFVSCQPREKDEADKAIESIQKMEEPQQAKQYNVDSLLNIIAAQGQKLVEYQTRLAADSIAFALNEQAQTTEQK